MTTVSSNDLAQRLGLTPSGPAPAPEVGTAHPRVVTVAGVGGGVGTSTVAALLGALDVGLWTHHPIAVDVLVCSPASQSTARAEHVIGQNLAGHGCRPLLIVVSDGVRGFPADSRSRLTTLEPLCSAVVHLPHVPEWRQTVNPELALAAAEMRRPLAAARSALDLPAPPLATPLRRPRFRPHRKDPT